MHTYACTCSNSNCTGSNSHAVLLDVHVYIQQNQCACMHTVHVYSACIQCMHAYSACMYSACMHTVHVYIQCMYTVHVCIQCMHACIQCMYVQCMYAYMHCTYSETCLKGHFYRKKTPVYRDHSRLVCGATSVILTHLCIRTTCLLRAPSLGPLSGCYRQVALYVCACVASR